MNINFINKEQFWHNDTKYYWFWVDGEKYAIRDCNGEIDLLDWDCEPLRLDGVHLKIFEQLSELYLNEI